MADINGIRGIMAKSGDSLRVAASQIRTASQTKQTEMDQHRRNVDRLLTDSSGGVQHAKDLRKEADHAERAAHEIQKTIDQEQNLLRNMEQEIRDLNQQANDLEQQAMQADQQALMGQ